MNEQQHQAKIARDHAAYEVRKAHNALECAVKILNRAEDALAVTVEADKPSWYAAS